MKGAFSWGWVIPRVAGLLVYLALVFFVVRKPLRRAVVSTFIATPLVRRLMKGQESRATPLGEPAAARS